MSSSSTSGAAASLCEFGNPLDLQGVAKHEFVCHGCSKKSMTAQLGAMPTGFIENLEQMVASRAAGERAVMQTAAPFPGPRDALVLATAFVELAHKISLPFRYATVEQMRTFDAELRAEFGDTNVRCATAVPTVFPAVVVFDIDRVPEYVDDDDDDEDYYIE